VLVLILDQALKIWVKTSMEYGEEIPLFGDWGMLHFVENPGMAFGITFGGDWGKLGLSVFRIIAVIFLSFYLRALVKSKVALGFLISAGLVLAGAIGNIIDSAFYGLIFSESSRYSGLAELFPVDGGYAGFLHGRVVDMLYFPLYSGHFPDWIPKYGGEYFLFFRPVFNIADMSITIGVASIILFYREVFSSDEFTKKPAASEVKKSTTEESSTSKLSDTEKLATDKEIEGGTTE